MLGPCSFQGSCNSDSICHTDSLISIYVIPKITGGTEVFWTLNSTANLQAPLKFQLQLNRAGHNHADDWEVITPFIEDAYSAVDPKQRSVGWFRRTYYRVVIKDSLNSIYESQPIPANQGRLNPTTMSMYREILRRERKRYLLRNSPATPGWLLKVKYYGEQCVQCLDPDAEEPYTADCDNCYGTGYIRGYHKPYPCFNADLSGVSHDLRMYEDQGSVITDDTAILRYLNIPPVHPWDVWVDATSDYRYLIGRIRPITYFSEINLICQAAVARLPFDHPVYRVQLTGVDAYRARTNASE